MPREFSEPVPLPDDLPLEALQGVTDFVSQRLGAEYRDVFLFLDDGRVHEQSWAAAMESVEPGAAIRSASATVGSSLGPGPRADIEWWSGGGVTWHRVVFRGEDQVAVLGAAETFRRHLSAGDATPWVEYFPVPEPEEPATPVETATAVPKHGVLSWLHEVSVQTVGGVATVGVLGLLGLIWAVVQSLD